MTHTSEHQPITAAWLDEVEQRARETFARHSFAQEPEKVLAAAVLALSAEVRRPREREASIVRGNGRKPPAIRPIYDDVFFRGAQQIEKLAAEAEERARAAETLLKATGAPERLRAAVERNAHAIDAALAEKEK